ncbi:uncharacterized protein LOC143922898 [Arctopsyche grandis]|uniref:uncharacterized protein LOC143922898 n=1 Tax=Arctopsyche grandis TaxID=121162 RepID=UPI00406D8D40
MSRRITNFILFLIWTIPIGFFFLYFTIVENDGFQTATCTYRFLRKMRFRLIFSSLFFGPFLIIFAIYVSIFITIKKNQASHNDYILTMRNKSIRRYTSQKMQQRLLKQCIIGKYIKTLRTTTMILGSYIMGWSLAIAYFLLVCDDCKFAFDSLDKTTTFFVCVLTNIFVIAKTIVNPLIYSQRMKEIKIATAKMDYALGRAICHRREVQNGYRANNQSTNYDTTFV